VQPWGHLAAAAPLSAALALAAGPGAAAAGAAAAVMVDCDHLADHRWLCRGRLRPGRLWADYRGHRTPHLVLALHSWELLLVAGLLAWAAGGPAWLWGLVAGWAWHLALDQLANRVGPGFYWLAFRAAKGFRRDRLPCPQGR
jgi:hypothetical protein